jgi:hypothetical protein
VATVATPELVSAGIAVGADAHWVLNADMALRIDPRRIPS